MVADRAAPFAHASTFITVPLEDMLDKPSTSMLANIRAARQRLTPEDMLAVAFNGLVRRRMRGAKRPGEDVATFAQNLRGLADALEAFNNYRPGTFLAGDEVKDLAKRTRRSRDQRAGCPAVSSPTLMPEQGIETPVGFADDGYDCLMGQARRRVDDPIVVPIEDEFSKLADDERIRLTQEWLDSLRTEEPLDLGVTAAELLAEVRAEE